MTSKKLDAAITWASLASKLLSFLQAIIPAFLIAWVEALRSSEVSLKNQLDYERTRGKIQDETQRLKDSYHDKTPRAIIDDFLDGELELPDSDSDSD